MTHRFADDGSIPNNPALPLVLYRGGIDLAGSPDPEQVIEKTFGANGWGNMWRNGIYPYAHYHSMIHEAMAIARGRATVRFGGENGQDIEIAPGDVVILPAGTGHQFLTQTRDLVVIGAYPPSGKYNLCRGSKAEHAKALASIRKCRRRRRIRCSGRRTADGVVAGMISGWLAFWDKPHSIYVNARHKDVHYSADRAADRGAGALAASARARLRLGEALHADLVAAAAGEVLLCEGAPRPARRHRRALCRQCENPRPGAGGSRALADRSLDLIVLHSVAQYLTPEEVANCSRCSTGCSKPTACLWSATSSRRTSPPRPMRWPCCASAPPTAFCSPPLPACCARCFRLLASALALRPHPLRRSRDDGKARRRRFGAQREAHNIGHNQARMVFMARPR